MATYRSHQAQAKGTVPHVVAVPLSILGQGPLDETGDQSSVLCVREVD